MPLPLLALASVLVSVATYAHSCCKEAPATTRAVVAAMREEALRSGRAAATAERYSPRGAAGSAPGTPRLLQLSPRLRHLTSPRLAQLDSPRSVA
jgi:hypothetical protein